MSRILLRFVQLVILMISLINAEKSSQMSEKFIIDNDAGGDDAVAILLALLNEKYFNGPSVIGLTTVKGNTKESNVNINNQRVLKVAQRQDIPIYRGWKESLLKEFDSGSYFGVDGLGDSGEELTGLLPAQTRNAVSALIELSIIHESRTVKCLELEIPIYRGSKESLLKEFDSGSYFGVDGLGDSGEELTGLLPAQTRNAVSALIELSIIHENKLSVITLGPLTNIAMAIRLDPNFIGRLAHLYIGAGHIHSEAYATFEFNAHFDVEAYHIVIKNANPDKVTLLPFSQVRTYLNISKSWRLEVLGAIDTDIVRAINKYEEIVIKREKRWLDLDPAVMAIAIRPNLVEEYKYSKNDIILNGDTRGIVTNEFVNKSEANVRVINKLRKDDYKQFLLSVFSAVK